MITFSNDFYLWLGLSLGLLLFFLNYRTGKRIKIFRPRDVLRTFLWSAAALFLGMALAGAQLEWKIKPPVFEKLKIIFAIDASLSSLTQDVTVKKNGEQEKISRLELQKRLVENTILSLSDDALGIIAFADKAIPLQIVLSRKDYKNSLLKNLKYIDKTFVRYEIPQGTDYGNLFMAAINQFELDNQKQDESKKIVFVLTDGEQQGDEAKLQENMEKALEVVSKKNDLAIYFIGVGDSSKPSPIPKSEDERGNAKEYYTYDEGAMAGQPILTRPQPEFLVQLANTVRGYYHEAQDDQTLKSILQTSIKTERRIIGFEEGIEKINLAPYLLIGALICLFTIPLIKSV